MRRAAKMAIGVLGLAFTCLGGFGAFLFHVNSAKVSPSNDYPGRMEALSAAAQNDRATQPESWSKLSRLLAISTQAYEAELTKMSTGRPDGEALKVIDPRALQSRPGERVDSRAIQAARELLQSLHENGVFRDLAALGDARFIRATPRGTPIISMSVPEYGQARRLARSCGARMRLALREDNDSEYVKAFVGICTLARAFDHQPLSMDRMVSAAYLAIALDELRDEPFEKSLSRGMISEALKTLTEYARRPSIAFQLDGEKLMLLDLIQWTYSDTGDGDGWFVPEAAAGLEIAGTRLPVTTFDPKIAGVLQPRRKSVVKSIDDVSEMVRRYAATPVVSRATSAYDLDNLASRLSDRPPMLKSWVEQQSKCIRAETQLVAGIEGTRIMLAIELYMLDHDRKPPPSLDRLAPVYLTEVPVDPTTQKPFGYRVVNPEDDSCRRQYLLYSFGADGIDNGGTETTRASDRYAALVPGSRVGSGKDLIINQPDLERGR